MPATDFSSTTSDTPRTVVETVWRMASARLIAGLARLVRDVGVAEDLAQDALVAALEQWPEQGVPDNPGAWLMTAARRRAIDRIRHAQMADEKHEMLGHETELLSEPAQSKLERALDDDI